MSDFNAHAKRVLVAHNVQRHGWGGMARMLESMHAVLEDFGWQTEYFTADDMAAVPTPRLRRHLFPWYVHRHVRNAFLRGQPYDIVNVHEPSGAALVFARARLGNPVIVAMSHGVEQRHWEMRLDKDSGLCDRPALKERMLVPLISLWQSRSTLRGADHILCLNEQDRAYLGSHLHLDTARITAVWPGVGPEFASVASRRIYDRACTRMLFSGTWLQRKGIRQVVAAFSELAKTHPDLQLAVLGAGVPAARVLADFPQPLHGRINVLPPLSHSESAEALLDYDIFLLPSFFEGTPATLLEAMGTAIPVITTATAGMRDVVQDGQNGILVAPGKPDQIVRAVERLMTDTSLRQKLGRQAFLDACEKYTWPALATLVDQVYSSVLALHNSPSHAAHKSA